MELSNLARTSPVNHLLEIERLSVSFRVGDRIVPAVENVSLSIDPGETLGLVGESGCGKSVTARSVVRLVPKPGKIVGGAILFEGRDILAESQDGMRGIRGRRIGFVFQDPMASLNPVLTVGEQIAEGIRRHLDLSSKASWSRAEELLEQVGIPRARDRAHDYPHQFSGGMRQRVMIAIALSCNPTLIIADEPTTALDSTIQAQILELIARISDESNTAVLLITHDLGIAAGTCDRICVMYAGRVVETGPVDTLFATPYMPYTSGLLGSIPRLNQARGRRLLAIEGSPPDLGNLITGCRFAARCRHVREICEQREPSLTPRRAYQLARCWGTEPDGGWIA